MELKFLNFLRPATAATALAALLAGCVGAAAAPQAQPGAPTPTAAAARPERPIPPPVVLPASYQRAIARGTRTSTGAPGPRHWQQTADYKLTGRLLPDDRRLEGTAEIRYQNRSPDALRTLNVQLIQNFHAPSAARLESAEPTGGMELRRVAVEGQGLSALAPGASGVGYRVEGTNLAIAPAAPLVPGGAVTLTIEWAFRIPQSGASGRMGYSDDLFYLAYWYPQMAVYDDVVGWQTDPFLGVAEFYADHANYDVTIDVPEGWVIRGTGALQNPEQVLAERVLARLRAAEASDTVVHVLTAAEFGQATAQGVGGRLSWRFRAESVRDVAYSVTRASNWDATRTAVGDRDGDGRTDYARIEALWRTRAPRWQHVWRYAQHSIAFHSRYTGIPYPWPHMTAVEGGGIIGGGMEYPMMTLMGDYNARGDRDLYNVTAHELAHMWVPMILSVDERRYSWMDEGFTTFHENQARKDFFPGVNAELAEQIGYLQTALSGREGEMMRASNFHETGEAFGTASYSKPATVLVALRGVLGQETFDRARLEFNRRWAFKHPYPWDLWNTFEEVSGRDLDWFWYPWYFTTWRLDQALAGFEPGAGGGGRVTIEDRDWVPMPVHLTITRAGGATERLVIPVDEWLAGKVRVTADVGPGAAVTRIEIDAERSFPDVDRSNNVWPR